MWEPRRLTTLWTFTACYRESLPTRKAAYVLETDRLDVRGEMLSLRTESAFIMSTTISEIRGSKLPGGSQLPRERTEQFILQQYMDWGGGRALGCIQNQTAVAKVVCFIDIKRFPLLSLRYTEWAKSNESWDFVLVASFPSFFSSFLSL
jgi:hypothetical protein